MRSKTIYFFALLAAIALGGAGWLLFVEQTSTLSKLEARNLADGRLQEFCKEQPLFRCEGVQFSKMEYFSGRWLVEYESQDFPKRYLAMIVHDNRGVEVTSTMDGDGEEGESY